MNVGFHSPDHIRAFGQLGAAEQHAQPAPWPSPGDLDSPAPTANELNCREIFLPPHSGQAAVSLLLMLRTSFSNFALHDSQTYSYIGTIHLTHRGSCYSSEAGLMEKCSATIRICDLLSSRSPVNMR